MRAEQKLRNHSPSPSTPLRTIRQPNCAHRFHAFALFTFAATSRIIGKARSTPGAIHVTVRHEAHRMQRGILRPHTPRMQLVAKFTAVFPVAEQSQITILVFTLAGSILICGIFASALHQHLRIFVIDMQPRWGFAQRYQASRRNYAACRIPPPNILR